MVGPASRFVQPPTNIGKPDCTPDDLPALEAFGTGRIAAPDDIANAIAFLVNDAFVTGIVLQAEGGQVLV
jgi:NAD(P)-dependent dehydrogenase (short-subunit alcohol dehydrogenase family)